MVPFRVCEMPGDVLEITFLVLYDEAVISNMLICVDKYAFGNSVLKVLDRVPVRRHYTLN